MLDCELSKMSSYGIAYIVRNKSDSGKSHLRMPTIAVVLCASITSYAGEDCLHANVFDVFSGERRLAPSSVS